MRLAVICTTAIGCSACFVIPLSPRSFALSQAPSRPGSGEWEVGVNGGGTYLQTTAPVLYSPTGVSTSTSWSVPVFEGHVSYGWSENLALGLHGGPAGIQPTGKARLRLGEWTLGLSLAGGLGYYATSTALIGEEPTKISALSGVVGGTLLGGHSIGVYFGASYQFQALDYRSSGPRVLFNTNRILTTEHHLTLAVGYELRWKHLIVRPEIAVLWAPFVTQRGEYLGGAMQVEGGSLFSVFPNLGFALASGAAAPTAP